MAEDAALVKAMADLKKFASELLTTAVVPAELEPLLRDFKPGDTSHTKVQELLRYRVVHHRVDFDIAEDIVGRLMDLDKRVGMITLLTTVPLGYRPSQTAVKYFRRATQL